MKGTTITTETTPEPENPAQTMRRALEAHLPARPIEVAGLTLIDAGAERQPLDYTEEVLVQRRTRMAERPVRRRGTAELGTLQSLIDWTNRFKGGNSALFLDIRRPESQMAGTAILSRSEAAGQDGRATTTSTTVETMALHRAGNIELLSVIDYHEGGAPQLEIDWHGERTARNCDHRGRYRFPLSEAWQRWTAAARAKMDVAEFGRFIEDNARDLLDPTPFILDGSAPMDEDADPTAQWEIDARMIATRLKGEFASVTRMIDLGREFSVAVDLKTSVKVDRASGRANLMVQEDHSDEAGQPLRLPRLFLIAIPVFEMGDLFPLVCTFNYEARGPKLFYDLYDAQASFDTALTDVATAAQTGTELPLFYGRPETTL